MDHGGGLKFRAEFVAVHLATAGVETLGVGGVDDLEKFGIRVGVAGRLGGAVAEVLGFAETCGWAAIIVTKP